MADRTGNTAAAWLDKAWGGLLSADPGWVAAWAAVIGLPLAVIAVWIAWKAYRKPEKNASTIQEAAADEGQAVVSTGNGSQTAQTQGSGNTTTQVGRDQTHAGTIIHGFTPEQFEEQLAKRTEHLTSQIKDLYRQQADLMAYSNGGNQKALADIAEALRLAEAGRADAEAKRADLENAHKAQVTELERLKVELTALQHDTPGLDAERLQSALAALGENRTEEADALLAELQQSNADTAAIARQGRVHYERGRLAEDRIDYAAAKEHFIRAAQLQPENEEYLFKAQALARLAGDLVLGLRYAQDLQTLAKRGGEDTLSYARAANEVAVNLLAQRRYAEAEPLLAKTLYIRERVLGTDHPDTATSYNNIAVNLQAQGRYAEAEPFYSKCLDICEHLLGTDHPYTAASYNNIAVNLQAQGHHAKAEPLLAKALYIRERVLGTDHPDTASSYNNFAANLHAQGHYDEAEPLLTKGLEIRKRVLGTNHPDTAQSHNDVAANLFQQGRIAAAEPYQRKAMEIAERSLGLDHPTTQAFTANLAALEEQLSKNDGSTDLNS